MLEVKLTEAKMMGSVYGIGVNDADYSVTSEKDGKRVLCQFYRVWTHMLERCYSPQWQKKKPTYIGCKVIEGWHSFMAFKEWMETQDWKGKHLDKDIIIPGNKVYRPDACVFVSNSINNLLASGRDSRKGYPPGVSWIESLGKYGARVRIENKSKRLGVFETKEEAGAAYREAKRLYILRIACCEPNIRVKQGLYRHSATFR